MTGFSADWLRLREPFDQAARATAMADWPLAELARGWRDREGDPDGDPEGDPDGPRESDTVLRVLDLGSGTGANLRELAPRLGGRQAWELVDHDARLLATLPATLADWARRQGFHCAATDGGTDSLCLQGPGFLAQVRWRQVDLAPGGVLAADLLGPSAASLGPDLGPASDATRQPHLLTCSALLDLVSAPWLEALLAQVIARRIAVLFALNVDGRVIWSPPDAADHALHACFSAHQGRDKGFGPALGAAAVPTIREGLERAGARVRIAPSDWTLSGDQSPDMLTAMIQGHAQAAVEQCPAQAATIHAWRARREGLLASSTLRVGHLDLLADWPAP